MKVEGRIVTVICSSDARCSASELASDGSKMRQARDCQALIDIKVCKAALCADVFANAYGV